MGPFLCLPCVLHVAYDLAYVYVQTELTVLYVHKSIISNTKLSYRLST